MPVLKLQLLFAAAVLALAAVPTSAQARAKEGFIEEYVAINGIQEYFLHYPSASSDLVILNLHGGPGQSEAQFAYYAKDERLNCSVVYYDQRGTGKTQLRSKTRPEDVTLDALLADLKETISYLKARYKSQKIILVGHSWGSLLGASYVKQNPCDVLAYVGCAQVVDMMKGEAVARARLGEMIQARGNRKDLEAFAEFTDYPDATPKEDLPRQVSRLRKLQGKYGLTGDGNKTARIYSHSPIFHLSDLYAMLTAATANKNLRETMFSFSLSDDTEYRLPVFFICGKDDWQVPSVLVQEYFTRVQAPKKGLHWVEDAGHLAVVDNPKGYNDALLRIIEELSRCFDGG